MRTTLLTLTTCSLMALWGCEGPAGPQGEKGDAGATGPAGADGADGAAGADGSDGEDGAPGSDGEDGAPGTDGADGSDGADGADGADGEPGRDGHNGDAPWGVNFDIVSVTGGSGTDGAVQIGDLLSVTFSLLDDDGIEYDMEEMSSIAFQLAGPVENPAIAIYYADLASVISNAVYNGDGTWTYDFTVAMPSVYDTPPNDTSDLGLDEGDMGGQAVVDGTYYLTAWAYIRQYRQDGSYYYESDNEVESLLVGAATTLETREVVLAENCAECHGNEFFAHGGSRRDLEVCVSCHVGGAEDRYSATDSTTTPGASIAMGNMVHKIHMGEELTYGLVLNGYPADSTMDGYPNYNAHDYSEVAFPAWPQGAGDCASCHDGGTGEQYTNPTRDACGACHDNIDFTESNSDAESYHEGGVQTSDANCAVCHTASDVEEDHMDKREDPDFSDGLNVDILRVYNQSGLDTFQVGDNITVEYTVTDDAGNSLDSSLWNYGSSSSACGTIYGSATVILTGPSEHMTRTWYSPSPSSSVTTGSLRYGSTYDSSSGVYTYTFTESTGALAVIPSTYPAQMSNDGEWYGQALVSGTYRIGMDIYTTLWDDACNRYRVADSDYIDVLLGDATSIEPRLVVDESGCDNCHTTIEFHGSGRVGVDYCLMCHTAGNENSDFPGMIHRIHASSEMEGGSWCFEYEDDGSCGELYSVTFPRQDGGVQACTACHGDNTAYKDPSTRGCVTCHDSEDAEAHAALNTHETYGESCDVCHGDGRDYSSDTVHNWLR